MTHRIHLIAALAALGLTLAACGAAGPPIRPDFDPEPDPITAPKRGGEVTVSGDARIGAITEL